MIHVLHVEMPGSAPMIAGLFTNHMQACWTMLAIGVALTPRAMWVAAEHVPPKQQRRKTPADLWAEENGVSA